MKTHALISLALAATLGLLQGNALAGPGRDKHNGCGRGDQRCEREQHGNNGRDGHDGHDDDRGAGPNHSYHRGDRLPQYDRGRQYVVDDWHGHGLRSPPRGYHWVQTGSDYVLVAITTGVILELLLGR